MTQELVKAGMWASMATAINSFITGKKLSAFAATTSAELAGVISDETGSGALMFGTGPTFTFPVATVAAAGTTAADAGALTTGFTLVSAADGTKGVKLPAAAAGKFVIVKNNANAILKVWPTTGDAVNALAANASFDIAAYTSFVAVAYDATTWYTVPLLPS